MAGRETFASEGKFLGGRKAVYDEAGRLQLEVLIHEGMKPSSAVLDVGCGSLRGGYWLMHFLDPGHYFGIEPHQNRVETGLKHVLEPGLGELAAPTFAYNDDFDLGVFGQMFDFVIARSVWTHTTKAQIETMLGSFAEWGAPRSVMLVSYHPASRFRRPLHRGLGPADHGLPWRVFHKLFGRAPRVGDYRGDSWQALNVSHDRRWVRDACAARGLELRELNYGIVADQIWLRIQHR